MNGEPPSPAPPPPPEPPPPPAPPGALPPGGVPPGDAPAGALLPWEERSRRGFVDALVDTARLIVTAPTDAFSRLRPNGDFIGPLIFGLIFSWVGQLFAQFWNVVLGSALTSMFDSGEYGNLQFFGGGDLVSAAATLLLWPILFAIGTFIGAGIFHLCLMIVGALDRSPLGFEGTFKVVCYVSIVNLANIVPFLGPIIALVGMVFLLTIGFSQAHQTSQGKALIAALLPVVLCCVCAIIGALIFGVGLAAMFGAAANA